MAYTEITFTRLALPHEFECHRCAALRSEGHLTRRGVLPDPKKTSRNLAYATAEDGQRVMLCNGCYGYLVA